MKYVIYIDDKGTRYYLLSMRDWTTNEDEAYEYLSRSNAESDAIKSRKDRPEHLRNQKAYVKGRL